MRDGRLPEVPNIVIKHANFWYFGKLVAHERWLQLEVRLWLPVNIFNLNNKLFEYFLKKKKHYPDCKIV